MLDADEEIREIKKEIIESRGLVIKTNNLINSLAADVKSIARRQSGYERRFSWNSAVAYVIFTVLCAGALKLLSDARIAEIGTNNEELKREVELLRQELSDETVKSDRRTRVEADAFRFYELVAEKKRAEAVEAYEEIRREDLSPSEAAFFRETVDRFRLDLSIAAYQQGLDRMRTGRYAEAAEKFQESVKLREQGAHIPAVKYQLARAFRKLERQSEAIVYAKAVVEQNHDKEVQDDAMWLVSQCAEELGRLDDARAALRTLLRRWPRSSLVPDARRHLGELNLRALRGGNNPD